MEYILNNSVNAVETIFSTINNTVKGFFKSWVLARQYQANYYVALKLVNTAEYKGLSLQDIVVKLNKATAK